MSRLILLIGAVLWIFVPAIGSVTLPVTWGLTYVAIGWTVTVFTFGYVTAWRGKEAK